MNVRSEHASLSICLWKKPDSWEAAVSRKIKKKKNFLQLFLQWPEEWRVTGHFKSTWLTRANSKPQPLGLSLESLCLLRFKDARNHSITGILVLPNQSKSVIKWPIFGDFFFKWASSYLFFVLKMDKSPGLYLGQVQCLTLHSPLGTLQKYPSTLMPMWGWLYKVPEPHLLLSYRKSKMTFIYPILRNTLVQKMMLIPSLLSNQDSDIFFQVARFYTYVCSIWPICDRRLFLNLVIITIVCIIYC